MQFKTFKEEFPEYHQNKSLVKKDLAFQVGKMLIEGRVYRGITQKQLAKMINTQQPAIARMESGSSSLNLKTLEKIAKALNTYLLPPKFAFDTDIQIHVQANLTATNSVQPEWESKVSETYPIEKSFYTPSKQSINLKVN